ncbi:Six-bladed beta-propeller, TolB-like protein [Cynara cardunculus var. scolymus]|uniref:Six-bladed beta-propeller, TolB-like protein n=1 Tax=Cynara cardunculus var. scolymus TaxID=59895 RepID=A0A118JUQ9_CYNCS|nr:Six-bladed beta-propeller, TolB-like protein [Cynara cardunculus var. scolymus]
MAKLTEPSAANITRTDSSSWGLNLGFFTLAVVSIAVLVVQINTFDAVTYPMHEFGKPMLVAARKNAESLSGLEKIGLGQLIGAEDIAYESKSGVLYTGCEDGWIKRIMLNNSVVENWVHTGGRPLGIAIADSDNICLQGLLKASRDGELELLTSEADGVKLGFTDGVAVAKNGMVYFTDASYKYSIHEAIYDFLGGRPHGRLLSYNPSTKQTNVLARDLYFANGVELSPDQDFVIFCETFMMRCSRYYLQGEKKGSIDVFADNLPGFPDNIRYDGDGRYWLAIPWDNSLLTKFIQTYPFARKILTFTLKHLHKMPELMKFGGVIALDLEGNPIGGYYDDTWKMTTSGVKIGEHLYMGSITKSHILRLSLAQNPLLVTTS